MHLVFFSPSIRLRSAEDVVKQAAHPTSPLPSSVQSLEGAQPVPSSANSASGAIHVEPNYDAFILKEFDKCASEIALRLGFESRWYEVKFLFLGTILLGFISLVAKQVVTPRERVMAVAFSSPGMLLATALGLVVSLAIDMHLRANRQVIDYMGIWVSEYVEPRYLGDAILTPFPDGGLYGWEAFLRADVRKDTTLGAPAGARPGNPNKSGSTRNASADETVPAGYHNDLIYSLSFWPYVFLLTVMAYALYLATNIYGQWLRPDGSAAWLRGAVFIGVHSVIVYCAATTHIVPAMFEVRVWLWPLGPWGLPWTHSQLLVVGVYAVGGVICSGLAWLACHNLRERPHCFEPTTHDHA
jgi:hypothetical protein